MATRVTRDHHSLSRNLKLNGNFISNDGDSEGISIGDDGVVKTSAGDLRQFPSGNTVPIQEVPLCLVFLILIFPFYDCAFLPL